MSDKRLEQWHEEMRRRRDALTRDPSNLELADSVWRGLNREFSYDARSYGQAVTTYRAAMLKSADAVFSYARAIRGIAVEIHSNAADYLPLIDAEMKQAIIDAVKHASGEDEQNVLWLCEQYGLQ